MIPGGFPGGLPGGFPGGFSGGDPFERVFAQMRAHGFGNAFDDPFFGRTGSRTRILLQPLTLQVRQRPAASGGQWWLPALYPAAGAVR